MTHYTSSSFDRNLDYQDIKSNLIDRFDFIISKIDNNDRDVKCLIYLAISMIQLRNGSRISEAINAFKEFCKNNTKEIVFVKVAKSDCPRFSKKEQKMITPKPRFRKIMFPESWISIDYISVFIFVYPDIIDWDNLNLQKRVLDYLLDHFKCNTHSLRYACINYLLYVQKRPQSDVAKFVGHVNVNMLVRYTQNKNVDKIYDLDM